jgi:hypothetical protein
MMIIKKEGREYLSNSELDNKAFLTPHGIDEKKAHKRT